MTQTHAVVIAGGGPTGLMLAGELALAGVDVAVVERRASQDLDSARSGGLHSRTIEVLDQAASYREGRVPLAGDACPSARNRSAIPRWNLGWKLAQLVRGTSPESLLDTYQAERHPVAARVLQNTMAQTVLIRSDARIDALREILSGLIAMEEPRKRLAGMISGLDIEYDLGEGHPLLGRRMPDLDLTTADGPLRVFALLHEARPVLLNLGGPGRLDIASRAHRVRLVDADYAGPWELPVLGAVPAPAGVLIRPDGHVAWVGDGTGEGLSEALTTWFGAP